MVQTQFSTKIHILRSDNGGEYVNNDFTHYLLITESSPRLLVLRFLNRIGVAERKNRHLLETA